MDQSINEHPGLNPRQEAAVRRIVREEIARALGALAREAEYLDMPYETAELDSRALGNIAKAAEGAVHRILCPHETTVPGYPDGPRRCSRCGEPQLPPADPFAARPLDPDCRHAFATDDEGRTVCQMCEGVKTP